MSSRANSLAAIERRVRRVAQRLGLSMLVAQKPDARVKAHGGYMLRSDETGEIVFGEAPYRFSASIEEIEAHLVQLRDGEPSE